MIPAGTVSLDVMAKVLAKFRAMDNVRVDANGLAAWITLELQQEMRAIDPDWDHMEFWNAIGRAERAAKVGQTV